MLIDVEKCDFVKKKLFLTIEKQEFMKMSHHYTITTIISLFTLSSYAQLSYTPVSYDLVGISDFSTVKYIGNGEAVVISEGSTYHLSFDSDYNYSIRYIDNSAIDQDEIFRYDVDRDGTYDLLSVDINNSGLNTFLNTDAGFDDVGSLFGSTTSSFVEQDFDGDGVNDLIINGRVYRHLEDGSVERILNRQPSNAYVFESPYVMDINGDGLQDVVFQLVTNLGYLRNDGDGTLVLDLFSELNHQCHWMQVIETVNGPEVIYYDYDNTINRLTFDGDQGDQVTKHELVADQPNYGFTTLVTDMNSDGNEEILIYSKGVGRYYILDYDPATQSASYTQVTISGSEGVLYIDDVDKPLMVGLTGNTATVYESDADLNLSVRKFSIANAILNDNSFVDMDGDGFVDIRSTGYLRSYFGSNEFGLLETFVSPGVGGNFVDFDGDGDADYVSDSYWYANLGDNTFGPIQDNPNYLPYPDPDVFFTTVVHESDMDSDGDIDLLTYNVFGEPLELLENIDNQYFEDPVRLADSDLISGDLLRLEVIDVNADGRKDIVMAAASGLVWWKNDGGVNYDDGEVLFSGFRRPRGIDIADGDGDGLLDIVLGTGMLSAGSASGEVLLYKGTADGPSLVGTFDESPGYKYPSFIDYNKDGVDDVLISNGDNLALHMYSNYDGISSNIASVSVDFSKFGSYQVMDVDGDADDDIIVYDEGGIALQYLLKDEILTSNLCPLNNVRLLTQDQVDLYGVRYASCQEIDGSLYVGGASGWSDISDFYALSNVEKINGSLSLRFMNTLSNLQGLNNLDTITGSLSLDILRIGSQSVLPQLQSIGGDLSINNVLGLKTGTVFGNLQSIGQSIAVKIADLPHFDNIIVDSVVGGDFEYIDTYSELQSVDALGRIDSVYGRFMIESSNFGDLSVLENLQYVEGLSIAGINIDALSLGIRQDSIMGDVHINVYALGADIVHGMGLRYIGGGLSLLAADIGDWSELEYVQDHFNILTEDLTETSFNKLQSVGQMNLSLNTPHDYNNFKSLSEVSGSFVTSRNATSFDGLDLLDSIGSGFRIQNNPFLTSLSSIRNEFIVGGSWDMVNNVNLNFCESVAFCNHLENGGSYFIIDNAAGCDDVSDIACLSSSVSGIVFYDLDEDGIYTEATEARVKDVRIGFDDSQDISVTGANGFYRRYLLPGQSFKAEVFPLDKFELTTPSFYEIDSFIAGVSGLDARDFGLVLVDQGSAYETTLTSSLFICNREFDIDALLANIGGSIGTGYLSIKYSPELQLDPQFVDFTSHDEDSGVLTIAFEDLHPFFSTKYVLPFIAPSADELNNQDIGLTAEVYETVNGISSLVSSDFVPLSLLCSFDPNDKLVSSTDKTGNIRVGITEDELIYTIRFQNTGNFYAEDVRITDIISSELDLSTFRFLDASHEVDITIRAREVTFMFDEIFLTDSTTSFIESQGFVSFAIQPFSFDLDEDFENQASIFFDFNEPIITNIATSVVYDPAVAVSSVDGVRIHIAPVPADDQIYIVRDAADAKISAYRISDLQGRVVRSAQMGVHDITIDVRDIPSGLYVLSLYDELGRLYNGKVAVMH